jgi:hypothetical protein
MPSGVRDGMVETSSAEAPEAWAAETLVPAEPKTSEALATGAVAPMFVVDQSSRQIVPVAPVVPCALQPRSCVHSPPPGALKSVPGPQLAMVIRSPSTVCEVTATTFAQLAGAPSPRPPIAGAAPSLPVAATTTAPALRAASMADWSAAEQLPRPLRLRFTTRAGVALTGMPSDGQVTPPAGGAPAAQRMASAMSEAYPLHLPSTRTGNTLAS